VTDLTALTKAIEQVLPRGAVCAVSRIGEDCTSPYAEERSVVDRAVSKRRREFFAGRTAARRALERFGMAAQAIPIGEMRMPVWPNGVIGTITHTDQWAAAVVAPARLGGIGIDIEYNGRVTPGLAARVSALSGDHNPETDAILAQKGISADTVRFSAKEAGFKAYYPATHHFLDFNEVGCRLEPDEDPTGPSGKFELLILPEDAPDLWGRRRIRGAFTLSEPLVTSVAWAEKA